MSGRESTPVAVHGNGSPYWANFRLYCGEYEVAILCPLCGQTDVFEPLSTFTMAELVDDCNAHWDVCGVRED